MLKQRQDAWTEENDLLLAETVLRHVREGSTQLNAFEEVGDKLNRTSAACGFRWNAVVRHDYEKALALAKKQRKQRQRALGGEAAKKQLLYTPPTPQIEEFADDMSLDTSTMEVESETHAQGKEMNKESTIETPVVQTTNKQNAPLSSIDQVISFLQTLRYQDMSNSRLQNENRRLLDENKALQARVKELEKKVTELEDNATTVQEDYETLMKIMNRARKLALFDEEERPATKFKMDRNGNLEKLAE
ncbi:RsfA family transcriptional regulator [Bacillus sp. HMF5848]|uniref:RsfA family transcriptional regulator n=1 Tax=Bacillus sp. HMF5848 TaxID=2495421 RepID=UPI000F76DC34|nr:RsfA family transcriptional regulator [Bacillus sp. HMF5848]RSK28997.1 RsfA family transcriptional regulator [Bacillus sp. HMF5848]